MTDTRTQNEPCIRCGVPMSDEEWLHHTCPVNGDKCIGPDCAYEHRHEIVYDKAAQEDFDTCGVCGSTVDQNGIDQFHDRHMHRAFDDGVRTERARIVAELRSYAESWEQYTGHVPANNMNTARRTVLLHAANRLEQGKDIRRGD